jgi:hypothetical protein
MVIDARHARYYFRDMDILQHENRVESDGEIMPKDVDPEGLKILREAGFEWDFGSLAFRRRSRGSDATIEYRFLREQKLIINASLGRSERTGQLQRLRILLQGMD